MITGKYQFFYDQMPDDAMRSFYTQALQAVQARQPFLIISRSVCQGIGHNVQNAILYMYGDHPELYDLNIGRFSQRVLGGGKVRIDLYYRNSDEAAVQRDARFRAAVEQVLGACFPQGWRHLSVLKREKAIFNYLADHVSYDHESLRRNMPDKGWSLQETDAWSAYGALVKGKAVCQGIACAFKLLCDQVEIPGLVVIGNVQHNGERHAWNIVRIDRQFYHVDCTWMLRTSINTQIPYSRYRYFNIPDQMFEGERTMEMDYLPDCRSLRHNPFYLRGLCVRSADEAKETLCRQLRRGESRFAVMCVGFRLTDDECSRVMQQVVNQTGKNLQWYLSGCYLGGSIR